MYKKFFGLKENPFNVNPDPRYLFLTHNTQEALASRSPRCFGGRVARRRLGARRKCETFQEFAKNLAYWFVTLSPNTS